ncbi:MAG: arsenate reductase ArsC [Gammaproteobacteria bacterium]
MSPKIYQVLVLCTGNSARSIMAESIFNRLGSDRIRAYSAGSYPAGQVHPLTLELLQKSGHPVEGLRSKHWDEFSASGAPLMDFVVTVCDKAAGEPCPVWPGKPITAHWSFADPAAVEGTEVERRLAFDRVYREIARRVQLFLSLPIEKLDRLALQQHVNDIGNPGA